MPRPLSSPSTNKLLKTRFCDLDLSLKGTSVQKCIERLFDELAEKKILLRPHIWISTEWFSPDGAPGIAIPFYLASPKLKRLEKEMMFQVEGGTVKDCLKILRHEAGHAVCNAYRLHFKPSWRKIFGKFSQEYPESYLPKPVSKDYVHHLDWWYAQAHPAEDFAETFAIWLNIPKQKWKQQYKGWNALKKLEFVDKLMKEIAGKKPPVTKQLEQDVIHKLKKTLKQHYTERRKFFIEELPDIYDRDLIRLFSNDPKTNKNITASQFLKKYHVKIRESVSEWTGEYEYTIDHVLKIMANRCQDLKLRLYQGQDQTLKNTMLMVTVQTMNFMYKSPHWINL